MRYASLVLLAVLAAASCAHAAMAPKYERLRDLGLALDHLQEVAGLLDAPIDKIEVVAPDVIFTAGRCQVAVRLGFRRDPDPDAPPLPPGASPSRTATLGPKTCR